MAFLHSVRVGIGPAVRRCGPSLLRLAVGVTVLWFLVRQVGAAPFEEGLRAATTACQVAAVTLVHRDRPQARYAAAAGRLNYVSRRAV